MTVKQLIAKLKRLSPDEVVGWADHDQSSDELNARVKVVEEASEAVKQQYGVGVVLRP